MRHMSPVNQTCSKCKINKPIERFYFIKRSQTHDTRCKRCVAAYVRSRRDADGGQALKDAYARRKAKGYTSKRWADKTPEERALAYAAVKKYRSRNQDLCRMEARQGAQMRRSLAYQKAWPAILAHYGSQCLSCGSQTKVCFDHVRPMALGGDNVLTNGQPLCLTCNTTKGATERDKDHRPDQGAWVAELVRLNPWLGEPFPAGRWHRKAGGTDRLRRLQAEAAKELVMPEVGRIAQEEGEEVGSMRESGGLALDAVQKANLATLARLRASLLDA
jgi:hypothetical protein